MYPAFDKIREMAAAGDYKRIPICKELYADSYTPVEMMRILQKASHHCYLLESASQNVPLPASSQDSLLSGWLNLG